MPAVITEVKIMGVNSTRVTYLLASQLLLNEAETVSLYLLETAEVFCVKLILLHFPSVQNA